MKARQPANIACAISFAGGAQNRQLEELLERVADPLAFNLAELGIGCHHDAQTCRITLEDEKALGTCHLALGNNTFFGGSVEVDVHLDGVLRAPSIWIDSKHLLRGGVLALDPSRLHCTLATSVQEKSFPLKSNGSPETAASA